MAEAEPDLVTKAGQYDSSATEPSGGVPEVVVVGAAARDWSETDPRGWILGGGAVYGAYALARLRIRVGLVIGLDSDSWEAHELIELEALGVNVQKVALASGASFRNVYSRTGRRQFVDSIPTPISASALPVEWVNPKGVLLAPLIGELGDDWETAFMGRPEIAVGLQGLMRYALPDGRVAYQEPQRVEILRRATLLSASSEDFGSSAARLPLTTLMEGQSFALTLGHNGAVVFQRLRGRIKARRIRPATGVTVVDTTGAGDIFLAAWLGANVLTELASVERRLLGAGFASVASGLSVAGIGPAASAPTLRSILRHVAGHGGHGGHGGQ